MQGQSAHSTHRRNTEVIYTRLVMTAPQRRRTSKRGNIMAVGSTQHTERLTRNNAVLLLVDHQVGLYTGVRDIDILQLKHNSLPSPAHAISSVAPASCRPSL